MSRSQQPLVAFAIVTLLLLGSILPLTTGSGGKEGSRGVGGTLTSVYVDSAPNPALMDTEALWDDANELTIAVYGGTNPGDVTMKSVYTDTDLYLYAEWDDPTMSLIRGAQGTNVELYSGSWEYNPIPADTLRAVKIATAPTIDGDITDAVWEVAQPLTVSVAGGTNPGDVTIRSLYNETHIFVQARWLDSTFSIIRGAQGVNPAEYSGSWVWNDTNSTWEHQIGGSEDRVAFMWDIDATNFETQGCMVKCHVGSASYLNNQDDIADMWHMKAARMLGQLSSSQIGNPTIVDMEATAGEFHLNGFSDDKKTIYDENLGAEGDGGRHGDAGSGGYSHNRNATKGAPYYIETDPTDWLDAMILYQSEIDGAETIPADPDDAGYDQTAVENAWAKYDSLGAVVPERVLTPASGSRGDVRESGVWKDGVWTVEISRLLETGHDDDVQFDDLSKDYAFGVATMDNTGGEGHNIFMGTPLHLDFDTDFIHVQGGSEDRITFMWDIDDNITDFETQGCMVKCHPAYGSAGAFLETPGEMADMWQMKTARSLPVLDAKQIGIPTIAADHQPTAGKFEFHGYVDDKNMVYVDPTTLVKDQGDGGRHGDAGSGSYSHNRNADKTAPLYMELDPTDYLDAMVLTQSEIDGGQTLTVATASEAQIAAADAKYLSFNAIIPERILKTPTGSRSDVEQYAVWEDGTWHTVIIRALDTGHDDDIQFTDLTKTYQFGIATMDNTGGDGHNQHGSTIYSLAFEARNAAPTGVEAGADVTAKVDDTLTFNGTATDPEDDSLTYSWAFGDGTAEATGQEVTHAYTAVGTYTVTLTVDDGNDHAQTDTLTVTVEAKPAATDDDDGGFLAAPALPLSMVVMALVVLLRRRKGTA